jgi:hypothetical protein
LALHDPPIDIPFVDLETGMVTRAWQEWLLINKRDKANRVEDATANNIALLDANGHPSDSLKSISTLPDGDIVDADSSQELANKTFAELIGSKLLASDGSGGLSETDLSGWVEGTSGRITVTDDGDGTISLTVPLKANFGITSDSSGLSLNQQANVTNASTSHSITNPGDAPADADALRDDLVNNVIPEIESAFDTLGTKINSILSLLLSSEIMAGP